MDQSNQQQRQQYEQLEQPAGQRYGPQQHPSEQQPFAQVLDQPTQPSRHPSAMELEEQNSSIVEQKPSTERGPPIIEHRAGPPIIEHHPQTTTQYQPMQQPYPMDQQTQQYAPVQQYPTYDQQYPHAQYSQPQPVQYSPQQYSHPQIQPQPMQQYQQSQQQQQQQQQHQPLYHQPTEQVAYRMPTTPLQHTPTQGTMMSQSRTEVAHPYRFRQNKFARVARSVHHHIPHINTYDEHGKIRTYAIPQQQQQAQSQYPQQGQYIATSGPSAQGTFDQSQQQTQQPGTFAVPASPQQQTQSQYSPEYSVQPPQHPGPYAPAPGAYAESYPYHHEIQPDYQQSAPMSVGPMHSHASYQNPMPGPSYAVSGSMPTSSMGYFPSSMPQHMVNQPSSSRMSSQVDLREVPYVEMGKRWCSIAYHEYDMRVGEKFMPNSYTVHIDGFCDPALSNRFCLGTLTNVNRNEAVVWTRRRISKGVKLNYIDGEIFIECLSDSSIFVCSPLMDMEGGETEKVIKVPPGQTKLVFSNSIFSKFLHAAVDKGFETVYKLTAACSFRVSFGKGWGNAYKRVTILNTPCWFEVQLNGPLQWLDKVLRTLRPAQGCGSTS